jgi:VanZ family protein
MFARVAFWSAALLALVMALLPQPPNLPFEPSDKFQHALAFMTLAALATFAYPRIPPLWIGIALSVFGAAIEFFQMIPAIHRDAQLSDWVIDTIAIFVVLILVAVLRRRSRLT